MTQVYHQAKFRWTENLTCRFIQLRKENGKLFTGRKYSAQAGWEYILRQMRQEFPTIMADVHYRVLKKKWSNLLQQYKELKNPVHGDKNKADDVSWPFYGAIDEILEHGGRRDSLDDDTVNPHEFLCVSVTPEEPASPSEEKPRFPSDDEIERNDNPSIIALRRLQALNEDCSIEIERLPRGSRPGRRVESRKRSSNDTLISRLPRATELSIKTVKSSPAICVKDLSKLRGPSSRYGYSRNAQNGNPSVELPSGEDLEVHIEEEEYEDRGETKRSRRTRRPRQDVDQQRPEAPDEATAVGALERRFDQFLEYTKRRDDENRTVMLRILQAVEKIADKLP